MEMRRRRAPQVKNKSPAPIQITAEQIIREAMERQETTPAPPRQSITDLEELREYQARKRKEFEDKIRRQRTLISTWLKYAHWEESQREFKRCRSVFERAIDVDYRSVNVWLKYAEMEMRHRNINHARNVWDRAVTLLPRVNQLWYKYIYMEDILGNYIGTRKIFERWMEWEPHEPAWRTYIKFERRNGELEMARKVFDRFVTCHPKPSIWIERAKFEEKFGDLELARHVYERGLEYLEDLANEELYIAFAEFEERCEEYDRARAIYKYALDHVPKARARDLFKQFIAFEKQHGSQSSIEDVILGRRRFQYEEEIKENPHNFDAWFDYIRLEEAHGDTAKTREIFERAIFNVPPVNEKRFWRRYIYLWINYAIFEELVTEDIERARQVYKECLNVIPNKKFSFSKIWILYAKFEVRQKNLDAARSIYGHAIGTCPKKKIFDAYIELEIMLGNVDRCRKLYAKYLEIFPSFCDGWVKFAELERHLDENDRARAIYELAIDQPVLDMPEVLWKTYIDFEIAQGEVERTRELYKRLLQKTKHVKVWISCAQFEKMHGTTKQARAIYQRAFDYLKGGDLKEERVVLVESWKVFEEELDEEDHVKEVLQKLPKRIKKKRKIVTDEGVSAGWEEYYDYVFPDEKAAAPGLAILAKAQAWKKRKLTHDGA